MSLDEDDLKTQQQQAPKEYVVIVKRENVETKETTPVRVVLSEPAMKMCGMLVKAFEDPSTNEMDLQMVQADEMEHVRTWLEHRVKAPIAPLLLMENPDPLASHDMKELVDQFDVEFTHKLAPTPNESDMLFAVAFVANYLDCKPLMRLMMLKFSTFIKGRTPDELVRDLNIRKDISPEEAKELLQDFRDLMKPFGPDAETLLADDDTPTAKKDKKEEKEQEESDGEEAGGEPHEGHVNRRDRQE